MQQGGAAQYPISAAACNQTALAEIWKDTIAKETNSQKIWKKKWGFLSELQQELTTGNRKGDKMENELRKVELRLPPISAGTKKKMNIQRPDKPYPLTSAREIGYRSTEEKCNLERFGATRYTLPSIFTQLGITYENVE